MPTLVVYNPKSGSADLEAIKAAFDHRGIEAEYVSIASASAQRKMDEIKNHRNAVIVAAGGDGTINGVAGRIQGSACTLAVLPAGTLNHFAKALGIPTDLEKAVDVIAAGHARSVDIGTVNKRVFLNNSSIGVYPRSLRIRDEYQKALGKWPAAVLGLIRSIIRPRHYYIEATIKGAKRTFRTPFVFVGNNEYHRSGGQLGERASLESGQLAVYILKATSPSGIIWSLIAMFFTKRRHSPAFGIYLVDSCTIHTKHHRSLRVACDGEVYDIGSPLQYQSHHKALRVITPPVQ